MADRTDKGAPAKPDGTGAVLAEAADAERRARDAACVRWVALIPVLLVGLSIPAGVVLADTGTVVGDAVATWMLGVFTLVVFVPIAAVSLVGAYEIDRPRSRLGRPLASIGAVAAVLAHAMVVFSVVMEVVEPERRDPYSWAPALTPSVAGVVVIPHIVAAAANVYVLVRLWRRHRAPDRDARAI